MRKLAVIDVNKLFVDERADCARVVHLGIIVAALVTDLSFQYRSSSPVPEYMCITKPD
jgi:hypothetical protein